MTAHTARPQTPRRGALERLFALGTPSWVAAVRPAPREIAPGLWSVDRALGGALGPQFPTRSLLVDLPEGGVLVWSGLNTLSGVPFYETDPTPQALADGQGRETRTNILIGATAAVGAFTIVSMIFTRWSSPRVEVAPVVTTANGAAPGLTLRGSF